jgi:hypothetical protein
VNIAEIKKKAKREGYGTIMISLAYIDGEWKETIFLHNKKKLLTPSNPIRVPLAEYMEEEDEDLL